MILNKGKRNQPNANSTVAPNNFNNSNAYFNDTDTFFNDSFQPSAQSTYYSASIQQQQQSQFYDPSLVNVTNNAPNIYNPNNNSNLASQTYLPPAAASQQQQPMPPQAMPTMFNPANQFLNDPMANMAAQFGQGLVVQGKDYVTQNADRWFSISKLKYYFAVDTTYVTKKLLIILIPFINKDWSMKYSQDEAVPPKLDVNAPDLYIPIMSFVTYILMLGICLGMQDKFTPEQLGIQASSALGWFVIEIILILILMQILSIKSALKTFDIMAFCGYKYFGMILCLGSSIIIPQMGYNIVLVYMCASITYFMVRNLKLMILADNNPNNTQDGFQPSNSLGNKRRTYILLFISLMQPFFMWWLTRHLVA